MAFVVATVALGMSVLALNALLGYALREGVGFPSLVMPFREGCSTQAGRDEAEACQGRWQRKGFIAAGWVLLVGGPFALLAQFIR